MRAIVKQYPSGPPTYIVALGPSVYEMSADANMPNGVCQYMGDVDADEDLARYVKAAPTVDAVPFGLFQQAIRLVSEGALDALNA